MTAPKYSVLMSVYKKETPRNFSQAVDSMISQTVPPDEFVLVCDGPLSDDLCAIVSQYQLAFPNLFNIIRLKDNLGLGEALRVGLPQCRNEFVARMDSDDIALPRRMDLCLRLLSEDPDLAVVGGQISEFVDAPEKSIGVRRVPQEMEGIVKMLPMRNPMNHVTTVMRKEKVVAAGGYKELRGFEDYYLWARLLASGATMANVNEVVCCVRVSKDMYTNRRGGLEYFRSAVVLAKYMLKEGFVTKNQYLRNVFVRFCQCLLVPGKVRELVFRKALRENIEKESTSSSGVMFNG